jgi:hypothetical protein
MRFPSTQFLALCIAEALLDHYQITQPPVPVRNMLVNPPADLTPYVSLAETLPFGEALWLRTIRGRGAVLVNPVLPEVERRFAMARALFIGLCASEGGQMAGLPNAAIATDDLMAQAAFFARNLLIPTSLLPSGWESMSEDELADLFELPVEVVKARLQDLTDDWQTAAGWPVHDVK